MMRPSAPCLAPGFWKRSIDEFRRLGSIATNLEGIRVPTKPYPLVTFSDASSLSQCKAMSDADIGGFSTAHLDFRPAAGKKVPAHAQFHGNISIELPADQPDVVRTGYSGFRTLARSPSLFGKSLWDIDPYAFLALRVKSDGRAYFVNVQTESIVPTDLHQHRLYAKTPGEWETVYIKISEFVRTNHGAVVEPQTEMLTQRVRTVGLGLIDRIPGPYELCVAGIWATNMAGSLGKQQERERRERRQKEKEEEQILI